MLRELDRLEIISIVDNTISVWTNPRRDDVQRFFNWVEDTKDEDEGYIKAGGGLSFLIKATVDEETTTILFDTSESGSILSNNIDYLGLDLSEVDSIVLSHGHFDHFGGLLESLRKIGKKNVPVFLHPNMPIQKGFLVKTDTSEKMRIHPSFPKIPDITEAGGKILSTDDAILLANGMIRRSGEIPRKIEKHETGQHLQVEGEWLKDPYIVEDVSLAARVKGRGLVVIVGCSHAGIRNIMNEALTATAETKVHAIIGGFHLAPFEETHSETVQYIKGMEPKLLVPCHCTGWKARHMMSKEIPEAYVEGSVGHKYIIDGVDTT